VASYADANDIAWVKFGKDDDKLAVMAGVVTSSFYIPSGCTGAIISMQPPASYVGPGWVPVAIDATTRVRVSC
jgi:hypothetical protein